MHICYYINQLVSYERRYVIKTFIQNYAIHGFKGNFRTAQLKD